MYTTQTDSEEQDARRHQCTHACMHSQLSLFKSCTVNVSKLCTMLIVWLLLLFCSFVLFSTVYWLSVKGQSNSAFTEFWIQHLASIQCRSTIMITKQKKRVYYDSNTKILNCTCMIATIEYMTLCMIVTHGANYDSNKKL